MYINSKDKAEWWLQKLKKKHNDDYIMMSKLKELAILKKVVRNNTDKIEEIDICKTQIKELNEDIWMYLNLNADLKNINN